MTDNYKDPTKFSHYTCYTVNPIAAKQEGVKEAVYAEGHGHIGSVTCCICGLEIRTQFYKPPGEEEHFL